MEPVGAVATTQAAAMVGVVGAGTEAVAVGAMVVARAEVQAVAVEAAEVEAVIPRP
jgi:precorrin-6B methylase 2